VKNLAKEIAAGAIDLGIDFIPAGSALKGAAKLAYNVGKMALKKVNHKVFKPDYVSKYAQREYPRKSKYAQVRY